ncbi:MAG: hypothetical protein KC994_13725 [Candidatus Omnitrophica bacterium]|nr:hypothetical protein [Candidatus Omnitrophota bacterium]
MPAASLLFRATRSLFLFFLFLSLSDAAILDSNFNGVAPGANTPWSATDELNPNLSFSGWDLGAGSFADGTIDNALGFSVDSTDQLSTLDEAVAQNEYIGFTLSPTNGSMLDLNSVQVRFTIERRSYHAPRLYAVFTSVGGFASQDLLFHTAYIDNGDQSARDFNFFLPSTGYDGLATPVEVRIYAFDARYGGHSTSLVDFSLVDGVQSYTLNVSAGSGGTVTSNPNATVIEASSTISISAQPDSGYRFAGWSGDLTGFGNPRSFIMDNDKNIVATFEPLPALEMVVGNNIGSIVDYTPAWPFWDLFKRARPWLTQNSDGSGGFDSGFGYLIPVDSQGWPTQVPFDPGNGQPDQAVHSLILEVRIPGTYKFIYEGSGTLQFNWNDGNWQSLPTGGTQEFEFSVTNVPGDCWFIIQSTAPPPNHLRNFRVITPGFENADPADPFHPLYVDRLRPFGGIRYMDWGQTNNSNLTSWSNRTLPDSYTQSRGEGVCLEYIALLSNTLMQDAWICIPHPADDNYVRETAKFLRDNLDPSLKIFVEYSNETWNGIFGQTGYVQTQGLANNLSTDSWTAGQYFVGQRSAQIWKIFEEEFGTSAPDRLVKVLATQSSVVAVTNLRLAGLNDPAINPDLVFPDALAIAPYFAGNMTSNDIPPIAPAYPTIDEILDTHMPMAISAVRPEVQAQKAIADTQGWDLICYEGGQHYVGIGAAVNDATLTAVLNGANRDPRMYDRYRTYLDILKEEGVSAYYNFSNVYPPGRYGSWGILEYQNQPIEEAHKYRAIIDWIQANPTGVTEVPGWEFY